VYNPREGPQNKDNNMAGRAIAVIFGGLSAMGLSQFPEFSQQYLQRIGGATEEVRVIADQFRADASSNGYTVETALEAYAASDDTFLNDRAASVKLILEREKFLTEHYAALTNPSGFNKLISFSMVRDGDLATAAVADFRPAVPVTFEGASHAGLGFLFGYFLFRLPVYAFGGRRRRREAIAD
jgi:hypothetical protein